MKSIGICIGASNISLVILERDGLGTHVRQAESVTHDGNPRRVISELLPPELLAESDRFAATGRKFRNILRASSISEPEAIEQAYRFEKQRIGETDLIVSAGGETFMVYQLDSHGRIINVFTGNKCASGTGEFFLQQLKRMNVEIEEAVMGADTDNPYQVSGRCSVFCKSDCTHALNKGTPKGRVVAGLCEMMANKILELLKNKNFQRVVVVGGVSQNDAALSFLRQKLDNVCVSSFATTYEALGAALWALENETLPIRQRDELFVSQHASFKFLPPLKDFLSRVTFKEDIRKPAGAGDRCLVGLDVGSTTTKAVVMRWEDQAILASCYLRTNGDPVAASRHCYRELARQVTESIKIEGLAVTGSGRQIAGLHALTPAVINEIIAHATAAVHFDPEVDTIFEIGGQDAKYTYITSGVPADYAMNEACSAGTGSFLEEAALESLGIVFTEIGDYALRSERAPNFSDQCAAFINSDIKTAIQEGIFHEDISAGLVYSICMNYSNRVKGSRAVGQKVFMQGGVCYNRAVPTAMAALTGKDIVVPPEPGLMGAFGVALELKKRLELGLLPALDFDLDELAEREVVYREPFTCAGGGERCDRKCRVNRIEIKGKVYPFGGACNRYYNLVQEKRSPGTGEMDLVQQRENLLYKNRQCVEAAAEEKRLTVGISGSLMNHTLYPLFYEFFTGLGMRVVTPTEVDSEAVDRKGSAFCYPVEQAHGFLGSLIRLNPDAYFLPHIRSMPVGDDSIYKTCPLVQGEPYYLKAAFEELAGKRVITPMLDFSRGYECERETMIKIGVELGTVRSDAAVAFDRALEAQRAFHLEGRRMGREFLRMLEEDPNRLGVVIFGRPYNAFTKYGNMGIPHKFSSRGYAVVPIDFLPFEEEETTDKMYWPLGQMILQASRLVKRHPRLFATYITNFSCGPDSFLVSYFRKVMGDKPSLTLEIDSHSSDAGIDTRIEAFLDVVKNYLEVSRETAEGELGYRPATTLEEDGEMLIVDSHGVKHRLTDPNVRFLIPSMGEVGSRLLAATFRHVGVNASAVDNPTEVELKLGQGVSSCKECLPMILTLGSLLKELEGKREDELLVYFMPDTTGPCRFGQYSQYMKDVIEKKRIRNVALLSLSPDNGYAGLGTRFTLRGWHSVVISDVLENIYSALLVMARDRDKALRVYRDVVAKIEEMVERGSWKELKQTLRSAAKRLNSLETRGRLEDFPTIQLVGEIYVRKDSFSRQSLVERLADRGIITRTAPIAEWLYYIDYLIKNRLDRSSTREKQVNAYIQGAFKYWYERSINGILAGSGLHEVHMVDVDRVMRSMADVISPYLTGEAILTAGVTITSIIEEVQGVISIGPFGCMPNRIAEALVNHKLGEKKLQVAEDRELVEEVLKEYSALPFLSIETDGNQFTQSVEARLEAFCLQVGRLFQQTRRGRRSVS
ncbi:MAG: CoA activase [Firmicutes bacterium]|nr:CoA activase [Bacillota bacterium]